MLKVKPLQEDPDASLAIRVRKVGKKSRCYYLAAFRANHEVFFLHSGRELTAWMKENPREFALTRRKDPKLKWRKVAKTAKWRVYKRP